MSTRKKRLSIRDRDESSSKRLSRLAPSPAFLDWRTAPEKTFSDWKIEIVSRNGDGETTVKGTYHVHKCVLVVESTYFQNLLFQNDGNGSFTESKTATSRIELVEEGRPHLKIFWTTCIDLVNQI